MLVARALPEIAVWVISESGGARIERPPVNVSRGSFQQDRDQGERDGVAQQQDEFERYPGHQFNAPEVELRLLDL